jgi:asparagine synthetase A
MSAQTSNPDTIRVFEKIIQIDNIKTNAEYYQAMLSLINEEIRTKRLTSDDCKEYEDLKEVEYYYNGLIQGSEYFHIDALSSNAEDVETKLQQYLINNPLKVQFYINRGGIYYDGSWLNKFSPGYDDWEYLDDYEEK